MPEPAGPQVDKLKQLLTGLAEVLYWVRTGTRT
jgi:hypothetical protein